MAESNPVFESFINKVCFTDTSAPVNCNQFSFITVVNFMKFFNFVFSTDHNLSIKRSYEAVNIKKSVSHRPKDCDYVFFGRFQLSCKSQQKR